MRYIILIFIPVFIFASNESKVDSNAIVFKDNKYILESVELNNFSEDFYNINSDKYSKLYGKHVTSYNCLNSSYKEIKFKGIDAVVCSLVMDAKASYQDNKFSFNYKEKLDSKNPEDKFSSVNAYYHINKAHDYFLNLSKKDLLPRITTVVNFQYGIKLGSNVNWFKFSDSMFISKEDIKDNEYGYDIDEDLIVMGQGDLDYSYDSDIIYREYSHAIINKLFKSKKNIIDNYGLSLENVALVEALADYFAASINDDSIIGNLVYNNPRNLVEERYCPNGMNGNKYHDSLFISSVLWRIRILLEGDLADKIIFSALKRLNSDSSFEDFRIELLNSSNSIAPLRKNEIENIFKDNGLEDCKRILKYKENITEAYIAGRDDVIKFSEYAPAYMQHKVTLPDGKYGIKIKFSSLKQGDFLTGSNEAPKLSVLFKKGQAISYKIKDSKLINDADIIIGEKSQNGEIILQGPCVNAGDWYFQFINYGGAAKINYISLSFTDFELLAEKFENCEENLCENKDDGYCEEDEVCINRQCNKRCSNEHIDGYCEEPAKCIDGTCYSGCSIKNVNGICPDDKRCDSLGKCRSKCSSKELNGYCDNNFTCNNGQCVEICSVSNISGYCIKGYECDNGICVLKEDNGNGEVAGSSVCSYGNIFKESIYLFFLFFFIFFIARKSFSDKL